VEDSNDLKRLLFGIVNDQVVRIRLHNPKADGQWSEIRSYAPDEWSIGKKIAGSKDSVFNPVCRFGIVLVYKVPNLEEIADGLRR
jgi:hypothetical protein